MNSRYCYQQYDFACLSFVLGKISEIIKIQFNVKEIMYFQEYRRHSKKTEIHTYTKKILNQNKFETKSIEY